MPFFASYQGVARRMKQSRTYFPRNQKELPNTKLLESRFYVIFGRKKKSRAKKKKKKEKPPYARKVKLIFYTSWYDYSIGKLIGYIISVTIYMNTFQKPKKAIPWLSIIPALNSDEPYKFKIQEQMNHVFALKPKEKRGGTRLSSRKWTPKEVLSCDWHRTTWLQALCFARGEKVILAWLIKIRMSMQNSGIAIMIIEFQNSDLPANFLWSNTSWRVTTNSSQQAEIHWYTEHILDQFRVNFQNHRSSNAPLLKENQ